MQEAETTTNIHHLSRSIPLATASTEVDKPVLEDQDVRLLAPNQLIVFKADMSRVREWSSAYAGVYDREEY